MSEMKHKRCPFCGKRKNMRVPNTPNRMVVCGNCKAIGPVRMTEADAWAAWDTRPKRKNKAQPASEPSGGLPRNAITDLLTACKGGAVEMADNEVLNVTDLQDLLNQCINKNNNAYIGGAAGRSHYYAQIASVNEGVYR